MVNKLHCSVDIILIVSYFGFAVCFLSFFLTVDIINKRGTAVGTLLLTLTSFFPSVVDLLIFFYLFLSTSVFPNSPVGGIVNVSNVFLHPAVVNTG